MKGKQSSCGRGGPALHLGTEGCRSSRAGSFGSSNQPSLPRGDGSFCLRFARVSVRSQALFRRRMKKALFQVTAYVQSTSEEEDCALSHSILSIIQEEDEEGDSREKAQIESASEEETPSLGLSESSILLFFGSFNVRGVSGIATPAMTISKAKDSSTNTALEDCHRWIG